MTSLQPIRALIGAAIFAVLAASPLRAQQHAHAADSARADSARKKASHQMPMNMPMGKGDSTTHSKASAKKRPAATKAKKSPAKQPPVSHRDSTTRAGVTPPAAGASAMPMPMPMPDSASHHPADSSRDAMPMEHDPAGMRTQHDSMSMRDSTSMRMKPDSAPATRGMPVLSGMADMAGMPGMGADGAGRPAAHAMMAGALGISMDRMGSGTTWLPDAVSLPSRHVPAKGWDVMLHGFVFGQYDAQGGSRGDHQLGSLNWGMLMVSRALAGGMFQARTMLSLDPATVSNRGYPLLLQTGEAYRGEPLHDRQHPHDFFMELGALYERAITPQLAWSIYAAPSGEPALGPVAFMHRTSAMDIPTANISHHWQDATHISFGVLTGGIFTRRVKLEGSIFNGREPDDRRWGFDPIKIDSYSGRLTFNPTAHWSLTGGYGYLDSPEALLPDEPMHRLTASVLHGTQLSSGGQWSSALVWGMNKHPGQGATTGALLESEAILDAHNTVFGRAEYVQKSAEDLVLDADTGGLPVAIGIDADRVFNVAALTLGYIRELGRWKWGTIGFGAQGTVNVVPRALDDVYGSRTPLGGLVFFRLRPFHASGGSMAPMGADARGSHAEHR